MKTYQSMPILDGKGTLLKHLSLQFKVPFVLEHCIFRFLLRRRLDQFPSIAGRAARRLDDALDLYRHIKYDYVRRAQGRDMESGIWVRAEDRK
jgi:hypothetical protein